MKDLIEKREQKIAEMEAMKDTLSTEKRGTFTPEERTKFDAIKNEVTAINQAIEDEKFIDEQKRSEVKSHFNFSIRDSKSSKEEFNLAKAFRDFANGVSQTGFEKEFLTSEAKKDGHELRAGEFYIPSSVVKARAEQRAQTSSNSSAQARVNQGNNLSFVPTPILYPMLGVQVYENLTPGKLDLVSAADFSVTFGTENTTITDVSYSPAKVTLSPRAINATASFTRELLNQTNPDIMNQITDKFSYVIDKAIDKELFAQLSGLTNTITGCTTYANILTLEASVLATPTAFLSSYRGANYWKSKIRTATATDSNFVWKDDNTVAGYNAFRSPQVPNGMIVLGDFTQAAVGKWAGLTIIQDPYSNKRNNLIDYSVIQMADVKVVNSAGFSICKNGSFI